MTTIAYRSGVMAADSRAYGGDKVPIGRKQKIRRLADGTLIGCTTTKPGGAEWVLKWFEDGAVAEAGKEVLLPDSFTLLVVRPDGTAYMATDSAALTGPLTGKFWAIGSGECYALGAMAHGASAVEAVRLCCELDVWSDLPLCVASHEAEQIMWME